LKPQSLQEHDRRGRQNPQVRYAARTRARDRTSNEGASEPVVAFSLNDHQRAQERVLAMHCEADVTDSDSVTLAGEEGSPRLHDVGMRQTGLSQSVPQLAAAGKRQ